MSLKVKERIKVQWTFYLLLENRRAKLGPGGPFYQEFENQRTN